MPQKDGCEQASILSIKPKNMHGYKRGFILPDGSFINIKVEHHNKIAVDIGFKKGGSDEFIKECKAIRIIGIETESNGEKKNILGINCMHKPKGKQVKTLVKILTDNSFDTIVADKTMDPNFKPPLRCRFGDFNGNNNKPIDIQRWISKCWP